MRFLLTNDDGIDAPGLAALAEIVNGNGSTLIVAPAKEQSGMSHSVTTHAPLRLHQHGERRWAVEGSPADCVRIALDRFRDQFDFVLAGVNAGGNLGVDVYHSGTVAAVREAVLHGVPGIAISRYRSRKLTSEDWTTVTAWMKPVLGDLLARESEAGVFYNVNLPCEEPHSPQPEVRECPLDLSPLPLSFAEEPSGFRYSGVYRERRRTAGADVDTCFSGKIAVTKLQLGV